MKAPSELAPLPAAVEVAAYRIVQEAVTNAAKHAAARQCTVRLVVAGVPRGLELWVKDDGVGFRPGRVGVGLLSMRERAAELGGSCTIAAGPAGGTEVRVWLPLQA